MYQEGISQVGVLCDFSVIEEKILWGLKKNNIELHVNMEGVTVSTENFYYIKEKETIEMDFPKSVEIFEFWKI